MLQGTVGAYFQYGATCFATAFLRPENKKKMNKIHKSMNTCIGRLYKTSSYLGSCAITGQPPMSLDVLARSIVTATKKGWPVKWAIMRKPKENEDLLPHLDNEIRRIWQDWWDNSPSSKWTRELIPKVSFSTPEVDFYSGQALTDHGCFRAYRKKIKKTNNGMCPECPLSEETARHVLRECPRFAVNRPKTLDWKNPNTMTYMRETIQKLWSIEQWETRELSRRDTTQVPLPPSQSQRVPMMP